jgi:hypothetical protein
LVNKLINKIKEKEEFLLNELDSISKSQESQESTEFQESTESNTQKENDINSKLDIIIEFQSIIYKIDSGYTKVDSNKINSMIDILEKI